LIVIEKEPWADDMKTLLLEAKAKADTRTDDCTIGVGVIGADSTGRRNTSTLEV
jgi:hypothetical protein